MKNKFSTKKLLALVLSLVMVMSLFSVTGTVTASADTAMKVSNAEQFLDTVKNGGFVELAADFTLPLADYLDFEKAMTLDLNGNTITVQQTANNCYWNIASSMTIKDGEGGGKIISPDNCSPMLVNDNGSLRLESGTLEFTDSGNIGIDVWKGPFTMTGGTIDSKGNSIYRDDSKVSISGGTIIGDIYDEKGEIDITGGSFSFDPTSLLTGENTATKLGDYWVVNPVSYMAWDSSQSKLVNKTGIDACKDYIVVTGSTTTFENGKWYVVNTPSADNLTIPERITVRGTANLILCDGATLTAKNGVNVAEGNTLNIYAQSEGDNSGTFSVPDGGQTTPLNGSHLWNESNAAIGGNEKETAGTVVIHGGNVTVTGGAGGAGIGGGFLGDGGNVTIYGGVVNATGGQNSAGIGGGNGYSSGSSVNGNGGKVAVYGGTVIGIGGRNCTEGIGKAYFGTNTAELTLGIGTTLYLSDNGTQWQKAATSSDREAYMKIETHKHDLTYYVSGETIIAACDNTDGNCYLTDNMVPLIIGKPEHKILDDDKDANATLTGLDAFNKATGLDISASDIIYVGREDTNYESTTPPTDVGKYKASITLSDVKTGNGTTDDITAEVDYTINPVEYPLWVGGTQVTSENAEDTDGTRGWSYTPADNTTDPVTPATLTLNGYTYEGTGYKLMNAAIYSQDDLTISLTGKNTVTNTASAAVNSYGIITSYDRNLTITGSGTLTVSSGNLSDNGSCYGIYAGKKLTIGEGATVNANGGDTTDGKSYGVKAEEGIVINGTLTATGSNEGTSFGIFNTFGEQLPLEIGQNSNVTAAGTTCAIYGTVKNAITGTGWTDMAGTEGRANTAVNTDVQEFDYKKMQFPAKVMTNEEYIAAETGSDVLIESYVQAKQSWWDDKATIYLQSEDGAYFVYDMPISETDYSLLVPGTKIRVTGTKAEYKGEVEITNASFKIIDAEPWIAEAEDVTALLASEDLIKHQNELVSVKGVTVEPYDESGAAFKYKNETDKTDDLYFKVSKDGKTYEFCVEYYLCGKDTEVYKAVVALNVGDVVDLEGFLYWYNDANLHTTSLNRISYTVKWKNGDDVLETDIGLLKGATPTYDGETPAKAADDKHTYAFAGWTPKVTAATEDTEYTAIFAAYTFHKAVDPTCETDGSIEYYEDVDGNKFSDLGATPLTDDDTVIEKLDHKFISFIKWIWDGVENAFALIACDNDSDHTKTETADVAAAENEDGSITYTATVTVNGKTYTDTKTVKAETTDEATPDEATPDEATPDEATPDEATPDEPTPDEPTPDEPTPDKPTPDKPTPDEPVDTSDEPKPDDPEPKPETTKGLLGDVNSDGVVDAIDALLILRASLELDKFDETQSFLGDIDGDGTITSNDALEVLRFSVQLPANEKIGTTVEKME